MTLLSVTTSTWLMTLVGVCVVFVILLMLVFILNIFTLIARKTKAKVVNVKVAQTEKKQAKAFDQASEVEKAAVAVALYLYYNDAHDHESGVLTHTYNFHHWRRELNPQI